MQYEQSENTQENNRVFLMGKVLTEPVPSHEIFGEEQYEFTLAISRLSNITDNIPITVSAEQIKSNTITPGSLIAIRGQFRSYNKIVGDRSKLMLTVFAQEFVPTENVENSNLIELTGYLCKAPIYRTTPFNREIADILVAVNREYNKSDYIPAIAWGKYARAAKNMLVGDKINISGRIQSREYQKRFPDGTSETRVAYEISINNLSQSDQV